MKHSQSISLKSVTLKILNHIWHFFTTQSAPLTAIASWVLALITWWLIRKQIKNGEIQTKAMKEDLKVRLERDLVKRFESELSRERKKLAKQLLTKSNHDDIQEPIMNFFEDVGFYLKREYIDPELVWHDFAFYSIRWWHALKDYITEERKRQKNDNTVFASFEYLAREMKNFDDHKVREMNKKKDKKHLTTAEVSSDEDITQFLNEEKNI